MRRDADPHGSEPPVQLLAPHTLMAPAARSMRIALGLHSLELGGSQVNTVDLAAELRRRGHHVVLWAVDARLHETTIEPVATAAGFEIVELPTEHKIMDQARHVTAMVDDMRAEVLHVHHEAHWLGPVAAIATRSRPGVAVVVTNWMMEHTHYLPRHAPLIVGYPALQKESSAHHPGPVWVLEPPVNVERDTYDVHQAAAFRHEWGVSDDELLVVIVTRVERAMKLESITLAIRAMELLDDPRLRLVIVGDGDATAIVKDLAVTANARVGREAIFMTGALTDPRPAYGAADVVLGMGGSALRGLSFAKPVIVMGAGTFSRTFDEDTAHYFLEHGFYGHADDDPSGGELGRRIEELFDAERRTRLGAFGRATIIERFSVAQLTTRLEQIYAAAHDNPPSRWARWSDVAYVRSYELLGRTLRPEWKQAIRKRIPKLRSGKATTI